MPDACIVAIASPDRLSQLKDRIGAAANGELLTFTDADALPALEAIVKHKPSMLALERLFAASPRGAALINRIKADRKLDATEIRVFAHDSDVVRVVPRLEPAAAQALDQRGTRRAARVKMDAKATAVVDGKSAQLVDLSVIGAQIISPAVLKPNQPIAVALVDRVATVKFNAKVAWTSFEILPNSSPRYRAGIEFVDANAPEVDAFAARHKAV
ncbi:MAG TPA: PilZ domain-containing protein [Vicinamibacterales bacterium]|nr:PilZ domain-containing protein [Vicinamibacterales bacterium]